MDLSPSTPSELGAWPQGCQSIGTRCDAQALQQRLTPWLERGSRFDLLLLLDLVVVRIIFLIFL